MWKGKYYRENIEPHTYKATSDLRGKNRVCPLKDRPPIFMIGLKPYNYFMNCEITYKSRVTLYMRTMPCNPYLFIGVGGISSEEKEGYYVNSNCVIGDSVESVYKQYEDKNKNKYNTHIQSMLESRLVRPEQVVNMQGTMDLTHFRAGDTINIDLANNNQVWRM